MNVIYSYIYFITYERAKKAFEEMLNWRGNSEIDLYPYIREVVTNVFEYPRDHIRIAERGMIIAICQVLNAQ